MRQRVVRIVTAVISLRKVLVLCQTAHSGGLERWMYPQTAASNKDRPKIRKAVRRLGRQRHYHCSPRCHCYGRPLRF